MSSRLDDAQRELANCLQDSAVLMVDTKTLRQRVDAIDPAKVRSLYERAGTPGEKAAAKAALQRMGAWKEELHPRNSEGEFAQKGKKNSGSSKHKWTMVVSGLDPETGKRKHAVVNFEAPGSAYEASKTAFDIVKKKFGWSDLEYHQNSKNGDNPFWFGNKEYQ